MCELGNSGIATHLLLHYLANLSTHGKKCTAEEIYVSLFATTPIRRIFNPISMKIPVWKRIRIPPRYPCESYKTRKKEPDAWRHSWASLSLRDMNTGNWFNVLGLRLKILIYKKTPMNWQNFLRKVQNGPLCRWWLWTIKQSVIKMHKETCIYIHKNYWLCRIFFFTTGACRQIFVKLPTLVKFFSEILICSAQGCA
jgi:hypothetical protein